MTTASTTGAPSRVAGRAFALQWAGLTAFGFIVGGFAGLQLLWSATGALQRALGEATGGALGALLFGAVFGLAVGGLQALTLLGRRAFAARWALASALGPLVAIGAVYLIVGPRELPGVAGALVIGAGLGLGLGVSQAIALRDPARGLAWAGATLVAIALGWLTVWLFAGQNEDLTAFGGAAGAVVTGALSALAAHAILRPRQPDGAHAAPGRRFP